MKAIKKIIPYVAAIAFFYVISIAYFSPSIFQNKSLYQNDIRKGVAGGIDLSEYQDRTGEKSLWGSRMFSGMPSYQIRPFYENRDFLTPARSALEGFLPAPAGYLFAYMLGFFILMIALRVNPWLSIIGSIAFAFSTYYLIIIAAGHIWKVQVIQFIPPTLAGIIWAYRGKLLIGGIATALFFTLQLFCNHIQMTYYFLMFVEIFLIGRFLYDYKEKQLKHFAKATVVLLFAGIIGFGANATSLIFTEKHTKETIRGGSELGGNSADKTKGLERSYATAWSYGVGETFTLLIPNTKGGATGALGQDEKELNDAIEMVRTNHKIPNDLKNQAASEIVYSDTYWGDQPLTSGPVYVGALVLFLFIFGLFVVKGYMKRVLLVGTVFSILLAWGHNFMWFTNLFLDYFPYYNKMRTVSSILIVAEFCIPILAILALVKMVEKPSIIKENKRGLYISLGLIAGLVLIFIVAPKVFFSFLSDNEAAYYGSMAKGGAGYPVTYKEITSYIEAVRVSVFRADAWRSLFIIIMGLGFIRLYSKKKINKALFVGAIGVIVLLDLFLINRRYLNNDNFVPKSQAKVMWAMTPADTEILKDKDPNYRVLNRSVSPFQDASTSYYHKSIGGYHGAKLRRYQDIIEHYMSGNINPNILNMLNTKYVISSEGKARLNPAALGHAWFVEDVEWADNADAEIAYLENFDPERIAVVDKRFASQLEGYISGWDSTAVIYLDKYEINDITYKTKAAKEQLAVFPEIYYDDGLSRWDAFIDGQPTPVIRANYILRAIRVPAGEHNIQLVFKPKAYDTLEAVSVICTVLVLLSFLGLLVFLVIKEIKKPKEDSEAADS
ncbi:MAG: YfhO family protein [Prevotellaceae bacterium]|jgi:MFS family permease|nr:YfhO family protein [Prevotellaceae bacterium]